MSNYTFTRTLVTGMMMTLCVSVQAQVITVVNQNRENSVAPQSLDLQGYRLFHDHGDKKTYVPVRQKQQLSQNDEVTVTCQMEANENDFIYSPYAVTVIGNGINKEFYGDEGQVILSLPKGHYDFLTNTWRTDGPTALVLKEQTYINVDTTLVFNLSDAVNPYSVKTFKPNGDLCVVDVMKLNYGESDDEIIEAGNVDCINGSSFLVNKETGEDVYGHIYSLSFSEMREDNCGSVIYMNDISDRYRFVDARLVIGDDTWYVVKSENESMSVRTLTNNPENYVALEQDFDGTPIGNSAKGSHSYMYFRPAIDKKEVPSMYQMPKFTSPYGLMKGFIDAPKSQETGNGHLDLFTYMYYADYEKADTTVFEWYDGEGNLQRFEAINYIPQGIQSSPVVQDDEGFRYVCLGQAMYDPRYIGTPILGHPAFSFYQQQEVMPMGSGCPVNVVQFYNGLWGDVSQLECFFVGRHGEWRIVDNLAVETTMKYDGETIGNGNTNSIGFEVPEDNKGKKFEVTVTNPNVLVDGLEGQNVTTMTYDHAKEDWTPPVLQMLQFRNTDDLVTDRFSHSADGLLLFAGGDFYVESNDDIPVFNCKEQEAEVSYAPYMSGDWSTLEVEEIPENYYMPGFGYFYRGSLANVQGEAEKGWFDLKIRLTDAAGNWQEQVISPAFRIDEMVATGISEMAKTATTDGKTYYSLDGKRNVAPQRGLNIVRQADGTVRKITVK